MKIRLNGLYRCAIACIISLSVSQTVFAQDNSGGEQDPPLIPKHLDMTKYVFQDTTGKDISLSMFKGKYILLDIWASWCRPCINEFPKLDSLQQVYMDKNLAVVQISCDQKKQPWLNGRFWYKRKGNQFWINGNEDFMVDLQVAAIPRYMLVDREGRLIEEKLPRPGSKELDIILQGLEGI